MREDLKNILNKVKQYYENKQEKEHVKIEFKELGKFHSCEFKVVDELGYFSVFSIHGHIQEEEVEFLTDNDDCPFTDLKLLENKIYEVLNNRLELLKKYEEIKQKRKYINAIKNRKLDLYENVIEKEDFKKPTPEQTAWILKHVRNHFEEGGSYRYLIYNRLGYDESEYQTFYENGGFALSQMANELINYNEIIKTLFQLQKEGKGVTQEKLGEILKPLTDLI